MIDIKVPKPPMFPKRWSREKRKAARAAWLRSYKYNAVMKFLVWEKFPAILADSIAYFAELPHVGRHDLLRGGYDIKPE